MKSRTQSFASSGIRACGCYHYFMALVCLVATVYTVIFDFFPQRTALSLLASLIGLALTSVYLAVGIGVLNRRPWARIGGIALGIVGTGLVLSVLLAALAPAVHSLPLSRRTWATLIATTGLYLAVALSDTAAILFLISPRIRAVFSGDTNIIPWPDPLSPLELFLHSVFRVSAE